MSRVERFERSRQRQALTELSMSIEFLATAEGAAFLEQIEVFFAPAVVAAARRQGYALDRGDVIGGTIDLLTADDGKVARYAAAADTEPWAYLGGCLKRWARQQWGHRGGSIELAEFLLGDAREEPAIDQPLELAVHRTWETLVPYTPEQLHVELQELLSFLAWNPPQRLSYETDEKVAAHRHCPTFTIRQVTAVLNIAWGGRPRQAETSLLGAFLVDMDLDITTRPSLARAVAYYKNQMRAGAADSRMLTDWK